MVADLVLRARLEASAALRRPRTTKWQNLRCAGLCLFWSVGGRRLRKLSCDSWGELALRGRPHAPSRGGTRTTRHGARLHGHAARRPVPRGRPCRRALVAVPQARVAARTVAFDLADGGVDLGCNSQHPTVLIEQVGVRAQVARRHAKHSRQSAKVAAAGVVHRHEYAARARPARAARNRVAPSSQRPCATANGAVPALDVVRLEAVPVPKAWQQRRAVS